MAISNPFVFTGPVGPDDLVGRQPEAERLLDLARGGHTTRLAAPRRYGKTSLLGKVLSDARNEGLHTVYVDFYRAVTVSEAVRRIEAAYLQDLEGPVRRVVGQTIRALKLKTKMGPFEAEARDPISDPHERLADVLDLPVRIFKKTGIRTIVVFDEFQDFLRVEGQIDGLIRSRIQFHRDEAAYIFAGSEPGLMAELFESRSRPFFEQARPIALEPLPDGPLDDSISRRFTAHNRDPGEAIEPLLQIARGHPQRAMLLAHHLFEHTPPGTTADAQTFSQALEAAERETAEAFEWAWQGMATAPNQRRVLLALARSDASLFSERTLSAFGLSKGGAQAGLRGLIARGDVSRIGRGQPRIVDPLLERWAARRAGDPAD